MVTKTKAPPQTNLIIYTSGAYGTFVDWCVNFFSGQIADISPFRDTGSAHNWRGAATGDVTGRTGETIDWWLSRKDAPLVLRTHIADDLYRQDEFIERYASRFKKIIMIHNHVDCHLLILQNMLTKSNGIDKSIFQNQVIQRYRQQFDADKDIPRWQLREMLSYWHENWHCFMTDLYQPSGHASVINVNPKHLISDFESCIIDLMHKLDLKMVNKERLKTIRDQWLDLQTYKDIDSQCQNIVDAVINDRKISTTDCSNDLINESFVLYKLRICYNLDFACTGVDTFPVDTHSLRDRTMPYVNKQ